MTGDGVPRMSQQTTTLNSQPKRERSAPLRIQFDKGVFAFKKGWIGNPYKPNTAQAEEWQRGFNAGYFENLDRVTKK